METNRFKISKFQIAFYLALAFWLISLPFHPINIDDAWMGEVAYWTSQGTARLASFGEYLGLSKQVFFYHKGLVHQGALLIKIFGFHAYVLKAFSVFYTILLLGSIYFWQQKLNWHRNTFYLSSLLLVSSQIIFEFGYTFRAETAVTFIVFNSTMLAIYSRSLRSALISGILVGLAVYMHINSLIFGASTAFIFLIRKEFKRFFAFALASALFSLLYFLDINSIHDWHQFTEQFWGHGGVSSRSETNLLMRILADQKRYFHTAREASISLIAGYIIFRHKYLRTSEKVLLKFLGISALLLAVVAQSTTPRYLIYFLPILYVVFSELFFRHRNKVSFAIIFIMLTANWTGNIQFLQQRDKKLSTKEMSIIADYIPNNSNVLGPFEFFFVAADRFNFFTMDLFEIWTRNEKDNIRFSTLVTQYSIQYIITNDQWNRMTHLERDKAITCIRDWCLFQTNE